MVKWLKFYVLLQSINLEINGYIITAHSAVSKKIYNLQLLQKDIIQKRLQSALINIHFSIDIWISPNNYFLFIIYSYFVNNQKKFINTFFGLYIIIFHNKDKQWNIFLLMFKDYKITQKPGTVIFNNHTTNNKLCYIINN